MLLWCHLHASIRYYRGALPNLHDCMRDYRTQWGYSEEGGPKTLMIDVRLDQIYGEMFNIADKIPF